MNMKQRAWITLIVLAGCLFPLLYADGVLPNFPLAVQEQDQWCWAGASWMILHFYSPASQIEQCQIAEYARNTSTSIDFGDTACCVDPSQGCNYWNYLFGETGSIESILANAEAGNAVANYGYSGVMSKAEIAADIALYRPFVIRWGWAGGGGHFVVGYGIQGDNLYYADPWPGEGKKIATYSWVLSTPGVKDWTHTERMTRNGLCYVISGTVTVGGSPQAGVSLSGLPGSITTDSSGAYTANVASGWSGTVTPILAGTIFSPATRDYSNVTANQSSQNYSGTITPLSTIALDRSRLNYVKAGTAVTSAQTLRIRNTGDGTLNWTATPSASWIVLDKTSGSGAGKIQVSVNPGGLDNGTYPGTITVTDPAATNSPQTVTVALTVKSKGANPSGLFETPANNATGVTGSVAVTGWAVDDVEVTAVKIFRNPLAGEGTTPVYLGDACLVEGARPDVESLYVTTPFCYRAGWGYMLLTNFLPAGGNGTFTLYAYAVDRDGHSVQIGSKRITCDNAHATLPFGALDTPGQGGTASGSSYVNFGWALTPLPGTIPTGGSTLWVWVDGAPLGHPTYNQYREDIATLFPGYANSDGAVGFFYLDPSSLSEGVHTISWSARDDLGREDGIGSRYFSVSHGESFNLFGIEGNNNDSPLAKPPTQWSVSHDASSYQLGTPIYNEDSSVGIPPTQWAVSHGESFHLIGTDGVGAYGCTPLPNPGDSAIDTPIPLRIRCGFAGSEETIYPNRDGVVEIAARPCEPLTICLDPDISDPTLHRTGSTVRFAGGERVGIDLRPLPVGARLDPGTGVFTWLPGPGFRGTFTLEFVAGHGDGTVARTRVRVEVGS